MVKIIRNLARGLNKFSGFTSIFTLLVCFLFYGFDTHHLYLADFIVLCRIGAVIGSTSILLRYISSLKWNLWIIIYDILFLTFFLFISCDIFKGDLLLNTVFIALYFIRESASFKIDYRKTGFNPAQLFIISFAFIILIGTFLLMMPNSTTQGISFLDAMFTSTSAVCVTGLSVVDTEFGFTLMGKTIILVLIQIGGLGIMTFASYFSFFFKGGASFNNRVYFGELSNTDELNNVFSSLKHILLLTLTIEAFGAMLLFFFAPKETSTDFFQHLYSSIFHSVSAFNNAGFSLHSSNLYDPSLVYNYPFQLVICLLIIFGGLGFPIMQNLLQLFYYNLKITVLKILNSKKLSFKAWILNTNSKIILVTTGVLLFLGTVLFYIFEYNGVLANHGPFGKWVVAFMGSVTPRTAGFNSFEMTSLALPTILITIFLMWIGASPASTGGGIKTSTLAIAFMNFFSTARGQDRIEVARREISNGTVSRAFSIIFLSLLTIGLASFILILMEPDVRPLHLIFEAFSAFSTVGLSINLTPSLSEGAKVILILLMFIGRVSTLTILMAFLDRVNQKKYKYASEEVLIN